MHQTGGASLLHSQEGRGLESEDGVSYSPETVLDFLERWTSAPKPAVPSEAAG